ncbi:MAG: ribonuclease P protein component [Oscillospiraceae bacterium]|jgi:ribonuclease P protein component|nr:ribonuclease P protein component [Oscillospiraceae bacterium]
MVARFYRAVEQKAENSSVLLKGIFGGVLNANNLKIITIKKNRDFHYLYGRGASCVSDDLVTYAIRNGRYKTARIGVTTSKKIGCAVKRNRARRVIRESYRKLLPFVCSDYDMVFVARVKTTSADCDKIFDSMRRHLIKLGCIKKIEKFVSSSN